MDLPYNVSDFAFPSRWDSDSGPSVVERAGRPEIDQRTMVQADRDKGSNSGVSRGRDRSRTIYRGREREYSLRDSEVRTLADVGRFRVVPTEDLARFGYQGDKARMEADIRNLRKHGLVEQRIIEGHSSYSTKVLTLTKEGHRLLKHAQIVPDQQAIYDGLVKPKEARHDAELYRLYQKVAREIERSGGKVRRVILDLELKKDVYRALARIRRDKDEAYERISVASRFDLKVVGNKIPIPDLRVECEDDSREVHRLDLEVATRDYRPHGLGEKAKAGFHLFARPQDHDRLRRVLDSQEITARIFAL
jgi:hypothetical protein